MKTVVLGTIGADAHVIGASLIRRALTDAGFNVIFLGAVVPQEDFINAAIETSADAILVSSLYGMGIIDCDGLRARCIERGIGDILLYVGGMLVAPLEAAKGFDDVIKQFKSMGFNRVYSNATEIDEIVAALKNDLGIK